MSFRANCTGLMRELVPQGSIDVESMIQYIINGIPDGSSKMKLYEAQNYNEFRSRLRVYEKIQERGTTAMKNNPKKKVANKNDAKLVKEEKKTTKSMTIIPERKRDCRKKKKNGSHRLCVDYRKLNRIMIKDKYPLPVIEDQIDRLSGARIFSTIDFKNGFFHASYLGYIIENGTIHSSPGKIQAVSNFPEPRTLKDVQSFLGLSGYFRKFIESYTIKAKPLSDLLRKENSFWFDVKLRMFNLKFQTELHTDACKDGLRAILLQKNPEDNKLHPVYYMSCKTTETESKYTSYELEGPGKKLCAKYLGPYKVVQVKSNNSYDVEREVSGEDLKKTSSCAEYMKL
ncbi:POLY protein, partial [Pseudoatta argentina]